MRKRKRKRRGRRRRRSVTVVVVVVYSLTFFISATRAVFVREIPDYAGATLRRFELRGAPRKHALNPRDRA